MVQIIYIGSNKPKGMIMDVDEDKAKHVVSTGEFEYVDKHKEKPVSTKLEKGGHN